jgi:hypothetical protein
LRPASAVLAKNAALDTCPKHLGILQAFAGRSTMPTPVVVLNF